MESLGGSTQELGADILDHSSAAQDAAMGCEASVRTHRGYSRPWWRTVVGGGKDRLMEVT